MKRLFIVNIILIISELCFAQNFTITELPVGMDPHKCYAKCMIGGEYSGVQTKLVPIYTGKEHYNTYVKTVNLCYLTYKYEPKSKECENFKIVTNTIEETDFEDRELHLIQYDNTPKEGRTEWRETVCDTKINTTFLTKVHQALKKNGFTNEEFTTKIALMKILIDFQRVNDLPVGNFNAETMQRLGVFY